MAASASQPLARGEAGGASVLSWLYPRLVVVYHDYGGKAPVERNVPEPIALRIEFDGTVPGLSEHRLSLGAFGEPIANLLKALRRIANTSISDAVGRSAPSTGRLPESIRQLDIELTGIVEGSSGVQGVITLRTPPGETIPLFDVAKWSATQLLDALDEERRGNLRNVQVRNYLMSLPSGVTRQTYVLLQDHEEVKRVEFGMADLAAEVFGLPYLTEFIGRVTGVGFEPGRNQIRFQTETGQDLTIAATGEQVNYALEYRSEPVRVLMLQAEFRRVLWLQVETDSPPRLRVEHFIFKRWDGLLRKLANETDNR